MGRKPRLVFVARWARRNVGSSVMRMNQLAGHMQRFHGDTYETRVAYVSRAGKLWVKAWIAAQPRDSIYVFSKHLITGWRAEDFENLRRKSIAVLVDYVDLPVKHMVQYGVDAHLATSYVGAAALRNKQDAMRAAGLKTGGTPHVVLHNYDGALDALSFAPKKELSVAYFGTPVAAVIPPEIADDVSVLDAGSKAAFDQSVQRLSEFNCHYCVRSDFPDDPDRTFRPFTKGITAAACNSVIFTNRNVDDAVELLGHDYPYMLPDIDPETVTEGFRFLQDSYGDRPWHQALDRVMALKQRTSHQSIAAQLHHVIQSVT